MRLDTASTNKAEDLPRHHWKPTAIADKLHCHPTTIYRLEKRIQMYESASAKSPLSERPGRPRLLHQAAKQSLFEYQRRHPYLYQDELMTFLEEEWGIKVSQPTMSLLLKQNNITLKKGQRLQGRSSQLLRTAFQAEMLELLAEKLVVIDESLKEQSCWRMMAYAPIGEPARWQDEVRRGEH